MTMLIQWRIAFIFFFNSISVLGFYRENHRNSPSCSSINKQLQSYITWTDRLVNSQYAGQRHVCEQSQSHLVCCTKEILNTYASNLHHDLKTLLDSEIIHLSRIYAVAKQQTTVWSKEYLIETHRLIMSSLETLFGSAEYRLNIHQPLLTLFNTLNHTQSTVDEVSRSTNSFFNHLVISLYRKFMLNTDSTVSIDQEFEKCLLTKAFEMEIFPIQRELLYILTSASSLMQIFRTLLIYIDVDIQRLKLLETIDSSTCVDEYAKENLCPICFNYPDISCETACQVFFTSCFNQTKNSYLIFASMSKGYSSIIKEIEQAVLELKLVERLSKLHIYFYDMIVNASNDRNIYRQFQRFCPNSQMKLFSPLLSLPPTINERRDVVYRWNRTIHFLFKQLQSSIETLEDQSLQQTISNICSNSKYASRASSCRKTTDSSIHWQMPSMPEATLNDNHAEQTRNQIEDLKKKMLPIQQIILSFRPKDKVSLFEYIPDFDSYTDEIEMNNEDLPSGSLIDTYENSIQGSLSERLYREIDGLTTRKSVVTTKRMKKPKNVPSQSSFLTSNLLFSLVVFIIQQLSKLEN